MESASESLALFDEAGLSAVNFQGPAGHLGLASSLNENAEWLVLNRCDPPSTYLAHLISCVLHLGLYHFAGVLDFTAGMQGAQGHRKTQT